jgi:3-ketoacyl-CoA synthase
MNSPPPLARGLMAVYRRVVDNILAVVAVPVAAAALVAAARFGPPEELAGRLGEVRPAHLFLAAFVPAAAATVYLMLRPRAVYLVDYACFRTASNCRVPFSTFLEHAKQVPVGTGPPTHGVSVGAARTHGAPTQAVGPRHTRPHV